MGEYQPLDERYFDWLCELVGARSNRDPATSHLLLAEKLYKTPFHDYVPNDFNRARDGQDLRALFLEETNTEADPGWLTIDCSMLEMIIALSRRVAFHVDWPPASAFWMIITNLELHKYTDERFHDGVSTAIDFVTSTVNNRTYETNGQGGLFPLKKTPLDRNGNQIDQRGVEIWVQMSAYLMENFKF